MWRDKKSTTSEMDMSGTTQPSLTGWIRWDKESSTSEMDIKAMTRLSLTG